MRNRIGDVELLGRVLRSFRNRTGLSQEQLGVQTGLHRNYIGAVERGERNPSYRSLDRWLHGLGVSWTELGQAIDREIGDQP